MTIRISFRYDAVSRQWSGAFRSATGIGDIVDHGAASDVRHKSGGRWTIDRVLNGTRGKLRFRVTGAVRKPEAHLTWTIAGGTRAYAGLKGRGTDVEQFSGPDIGVRMDAVPT